MGSIASPSLPAALVSRGTGCLFRRPRPRLCAKLKRRFSALHMTRCERARTLHVQALHVARRERRGSVNSLRMMRIHPDECIDCGVCEPECPVNAIKADSEPGLEKWLSLNAEYAKIWPNITAKKAPPPDWKEWEGKPDKLQYFSPKPGTGD